MLVRFWISSKNGRSIEETKEVPNDFNQQEIEVILNSWCRGVSKGMFGSVCYGYQTLEFPLRLKSRQKWLV
jgi:hypothetical protein